MGTARRAGLDMTGTVADQAVNLAAAAWPALSLEDVIDALADLVAVRVRGRATLVP